MKARMTAMAGLAMLLLAGGGTMADGFGTDGNQFTIDFVTITANPGVTRSTNTSGDGVETFTAGVGESDYTDPGYDYRMGIYEITNDQWTKFEAELGVPVTGIESYLYDESPYWTGTYVPTNEVSWHEAAQFVNWLNTSTGHQAAYRFMGTQGTGNYALSIWSPAEAAGGTNEYRHKDAFYFLPTEDEWVKAAYWSGSTLQTYARPDDTLPVEDVEANYDYETGAQPWDVGSGSEELNGTFDMMGNIAEWMESPYCDTNYSTGGGRGLRGGSYGSPDYRPLASSHRDSIGIPPDEVIFVGFRVASVPEPASMALLSLGGLAMLGRRRRKR